MAWIMTPTQMQSTLALSLESAPATGQALTGGRCVLGPGVAVCLPRLAVGTFGIRHTPNSAAYGGGSTVLIISDLAQWYSGVDSHAGTVSAIMAGRNRPPLLYSAARGKDGSSSSEYAKWSRRFFGDLNHDASTWQQNYSSRGDAVHSKIWCFLRQSNADHGYLCLGRYMARSFDNETLTLDPINLAVRASPPALNMLADAAARLQAVVAHGNQPAAGASADDDDETLAQRQRRVRQRR
jgi:hypothetical protein